MVKSKSPYEDLRSQRIEENKKRIKDFKLNHLAINFKNSSPNSSQVKQSKPRVLVQKKLEFVQVRRSNRLSDKPAPVYEEVFVYEYARRRSINGFSKPRAIPLGDFPITTEIDRKNATTKAVNVEKILGVMGSLALKYLPKRDETITLVDEVGEEFPTNYLALKNGLSC
ncbi:B3 domain-containing protein Os06g0194400-like [Papaver somniferum]|uniref:B3 domain-containing protein Os06g0194400-like n=1 Tax=Papaver somniferum TaxID=3469 RepID=UPI000E6F9582|nr:B3 domain-containing protein Os06g0194400-like [Papaver somniferum]